MAAYLYLPLLIVHVSLAVASPAVFSLRAARALTGEDPSTGLPQKLAQGIDPLLLLAGLALAFILGQYPFIHGWVTAKLLALAAYLGLGHAGLRRARTRRAQLAVWLGGLLIVLYAYAVAFTKSPSIV